jgi:hypothetical protein
MMTSTKDGIQINIDILSSYIRSLVNRFFKILPMREDEEPTLIEYMNSLLIELLGCKELMNAVKDDPDFATLLFILQFLITHPESSISTYKREVFKAISVCNKLKAQISVSSCEGVDG